MQDNTTFRGKVTARFKKHPIIYTLVLIVLIGALASRANKNQGAGNMFSSSAEAAKQVYRFDAASIVAQYHENEVSADERYKGLELIAVGTVESITKDFMNNIIVALRGDGMFFALRCKIRDGEAAASRLSKGQEVEIRGKCKGMVIGSVMLDGCTIIK